MRKIKWIDCTSVDTQQCLCGINEVLARLGVAENDIINIHHERHFPPIPILDGSEPASVTLFVFYWGN